MRHRHVGQVLAIERASYPKPWSAQVFHDELDQARDGHRYYLVARRGRPVVGYGGLMFVADEAHVTNIAVHPDHRRDGVGARGCSARSAGEAIERGCTAWTLEVRASNVARPGAVPTFGFAPAGVREQLLRGRRGRHRDVVPRHPVAPSTPRRLRGARAVTDADRRVRRSTSGRDTLVLGIETSCDETAAALVMGGSDVVSSVVSSQIELHATFGGVVPEIASRAHLDLLNPVIARAIVEAGVDDRRIDAVACTDRARA